MIDLTFREAAVLARVLEVLGHPEGPFGGQHILTKACNNTAEYLQATEEEVGEEFISAVNKIRNFIDVKAKRVYDEIMKNIN